MTANKWRGEVPFPALGKDVFISFPLPDLAALEAEYGDDFFAVIENAAGKASPSVLPTCMAIGLKRRNGDGAVEKVWAEIGMPALEGEKFSLADIGKVLLDAISISWMHKTYDELVAEAVEARKKQDAENLKRAKEAADEAGLPFDEALSDGLLKLLTVLASAPTPSGS